MKYIKTAIIAIFLFVSPSQVAFWAWWIEMESCSSGVYSAFYPSSCSVCWFGTQRLYEWEDTDFWDFYNSTDSNEEIFASSSNASVTDFWWYLNDESLSWLWLRSTWTPVNLSHNSAVIFFVDNLRLTSRPPDVNTPVWRIDYFLRWAPVVSNWNFSFTWERGYREWTESLVNWEYVLDAPNFIVDPDPVSQKSINTSDIFEHNECYVMLPAWCWDGLVTNWETCDPLDPATSAWCNPLTCQPFPTFVPFMAVDIVDDNADDLDGVQWDDTQTVNVGSGSTFRVTLTNAWTDALENITLLDIVAPECAWSATLTGTTFTWPSTWTNLSATWVINGSLLPLIWSLSYNCNLDNISVDITNTITAAWLWVNSSLITWALPDTTLVVAWTGSTNLCWNGIIETPEVCDFADPTQTAWGTSGCTATCQPDNGWGWGGTWPQCRAIDAWTYDSTTNIRSGIVCTWNSDVNSIRLDCWNGTNLYGSGSTATFSCDYSGNANPDEIKPICYVAWSTWLTNPNSSSWSTRLACTPGRPNGGWGGGWGWGGFSKTCWDGVVQRPNDSWFNEQCDTTQTWCSATCKALVTTQPFGGVVKMLPGNDYVIIGDGMNPYEAHTLSYPYIENLSEDPNTDIAFDEICVYNTSGSSLSGDGTQCEPMGVIYPWEKAYFGRTPDYRWNTSGITSGNIGENVLRYSVKNDGTDYPDAFFSTELKVRVSKPSIATVWGWTSFLNNTSAVKTQDIAKWEHKDANKNFVWAWVWENGLSYTKDVSDTASVNKIWEEWSVYNNTLNGSINDLWSNWWTRTDINDFDNYNGIENVYILKNYNFKIESDLFSSINWPRTYVIENWNLIISSDITYSDNIAFVVKWWNIIIDEEVRSIKGVYISIPKWSRWWKFIWLWTTNNILKVEWSLYWNIENLVSKRTYINENASWQISVWTIVSFGSSIFRKPAPLTWKFIWEYLEAEKIAK